MKQRLNNTRLASPWLNCRGNSLKVLVRALLLLTVCCRTKKAVSWDNCKHSPAPGSVLHILFLVWASFDQICTKGAIDLNNLMDHVHWKVANSSTQKIPACWASLQEIARTIIYMYRGCRAGKRKYPVQTLPSTTSSSKAARVWCSVGCGSASLHIPSEPSWWHLKISSTESQGERPCMVYLDAAAWIRLELVQWLRNSTTSYWNTKYTMRQQYCMHGLDLLA